MARRSAEIRGTLRALPVFLAGLCIAPALADAQAPCDPPSGASGPSRDLYCIELLPTAAAESARGTAQLDWIPGPFTVNVAPDGRQRWNLTLALAGLPRAPARGPGTGFVAWAAAPSMAWFQRLGVVRDGIARLGPVAYDRFVVLVSAEPDTLASERRGPIVLRGESAGNRLRPADTYQFFLGALVGRPGGATGGQDPPLAHAEHAALTDSLGWAPVPMYPGLDMLPAEMALRPGTRAWLPADDARVPPSRPREVVRQADGDTLRLTAAPVRRTIAGRTYTMFGFNGQHPGPLLVVPQGGTVTVSLANHLPVPTTVHWHGLRLDNRSDGVPDLTQPAVPPGGTWTYTLRFPDGGIYWYHPHVREDLQQDLGLYGNIFVRPSRAGAYGRVHREEFVILDDILIGEHGLVPWGADTPTHAAMGRFGNVFLVNGEPRWRLTVRRGEIVRLFLTNASSARTFNLSFGGGARMKVVGSDVGTFAREEWLESVVIAPAERYIVDVQFDAPGEVALLNRVRALDHLYARFFDAVDTLGIVAVGRGPIPQSPLPIPAFDSLRFDSLVAAEHAPFLRAADTLPPRVLELRVAFTSLPFVSERLMRIDSVYFNPVEWAGTMPGMNWATTGAQARWIVRDPATGRENLDVAWRFRRGELVRLRLVGSRDVLHGMQHPIHLHGQRFLVLAVNGVRSQNPAWKDTALVPAGGSVDLVVEMSNPGRWMLHCHIAEHLQAGMMMVFDVQEE